MFPISIFTWPKAIPASSLRLRVCGFPHITSVFTFLQFPANHRHIHASVIQPYIITKITTHSQHKLRSKVRSSQWGAANHGLGWVHLGTRNVQRKMAWRERCLRASIGPLYRGGHSIEFLFIERQLLWRGGWVQWRAEIRWCPEPTPIQNRRWMPPSAQT